MNRLIALLLIAAASFAANTQEGMFSEIGKIESDLSAITGLAFTRKVPYAVIGRDQLRRYLEDRMKESVKPEDIRAEELTLKMLGLIPQDYNLRDSTVDLLTEQAAAFYDYHKKKLFILENNSGPEAKFALVHELAHALADQHFRLDKYIHGGAKSDDAETARLAVMEGQASWLMSAYMSKQAGGPPDVPEAVLKLMAASLESGADHYPVFAQAPLYIRESLVFPYAQGMVFQDAVFRKIGREGFGQVFQRPPVSTQQILHPEKYFEPAKAALPSLPALPTTKGLRKLGDGTLGELDYRVLLSQYAGKVEGEKAAAHLVGGVYELREHKRDKSPVLACAALWDSPDSAQQFFALYREVLKKKWTKLDVQQEGSGSISGKGDSGYFRVWVDGPAVSSIEGWHSSLH